jgi:hypothetical protein
MDSFKVKGSIIIHVYEDENIIREILVDNILVNGGINSILEGIAGLNPNPLVNRMVIGINDTPALPTNTSLFNKILHLDLNAPIILGNIIRYKAIFVKNSVTTNKWIKEVGLAYFDGTSELLITRAVLDLEKEVFMTPNNSLALTYQLTITNG